MNAAQWDVSPEVAATGLGQGTGGMKRVIVIGAGVAGLIAAYELSRAGHQPLVLEARSRVGGRVYTVREFAGGQYGEVGASRIPAQHHLAIAYCEHLGMTLRPFITGNPRGLMHLEGRAMRAEDVALRPEDLGSVGDDQESWERLWSQAASEIRSAYAAPSTQIADLSPREFLQHRGYSETAIALCGLLSSRDQQLAVLEAEQFYQITGHPTERMHEIVGGCDLLTDALFRQVARHVRMGAEVNAVVQDADGVTVHFDSPAAERSVRADYAVCTLPVPVLSDIEFVPGLPAAKEDALRQLRYHGSTRVFLQMRRRFWEHPKYDIVGGATVTDLPIRRMVYPSYSDPSNARGVLLASDSWDRDAQLWESMDPGPRIARVIAEAAQIHPEVNDDVEAGFTWSWDRDRHARGAMANFGPGQFTALRPQLAGPQGRVHFAGEHCSIYHGWIQGALDSGIRAARAVHTAPRATYTATSRSG